MEPLPENNGRMARWGDSVGFSFRDRMEKIAQLVRMRKNWARIIGRAQTPADRRHYQAKIDQINAELKDLLVLD